MVPKIYRNISEVLTLKKAYEKDGRSVNQDDLSIIKDAAIVFTREKILWVGKDKELPSEYKNLKSKNFKNKVITPEVVDSHTHVVFAGNRSFEYSMRLNGADYEEIAKAGGGILSTTNATNAATFNELFRVGKKRIERMHAMGIGTIEIKSGYGLNFSKEYEISHAINDLKNYFKDSVQIINTYMAAHAVPKEYKNSSEYLGRVVIPLLEKLYPENIIDCVDIFHEESYFSKDDVKELFDLCIKLELPIKIHADEFRNNNGAKLAVEYNALSADHLMNASNEGIKLLSKSNTVATLLPGTSLFLGKPLANARKFLDANCKVALASDYNPGSSHCDNLILLASIAAPLYKMNLGELWTSITLNASHALGLKNQGAILKDLSPRFSIFDVATIDEITYNWGNNLAIKDLP